MFAGAALLTPVALWLYSHVTVAPGDRAAVLGLSPAWARGKQEQVASHSPLSFVKGLLVFLPKSYVEVLMLSMGLYLETGTLKR